MAAASPYLLFAALIHAGIDGLDNRLPVPEATHDDLANWNNAALAAKNIARLPVTLGSALDFLEESEWARAALGETLIDAFLRHKRCEIETMAGLTEEQICDRYHAAY